MQWLHTVNTADREGDWRKETFFETPTEAHLFFVKHDTAANRMRKKSDAASWVSAHTMSSSRPCRLGRCFPGPPTLDHRSRTGCTAAPRRRCITRSRSSRCIHGGETLGLLLSGSAALLALNDAPRSPRHSRQLLGREAGGGRSSVDHSNVLSLHPQQDL